MRLLVTGGAGFIGSNFVHYWLECHPQDAVVVYDLLTYAGNRESLSGVEDSIEFVQGDICDRDLAEATLREHGTEVVVNFAAESHNSLAVLDPTRFFRTNVLGTQTMLDASMAAGVARFHHVSTCEVYGDLALDTNEMFTEDSPYRPRTPYNASKAGADHAVRAYFETFGLPVTITNCSNNYGPFQFPEKVIPLFTTNALDDEPLPMYASTQNKREWLHVLDHCEAIDLVLHTAAWTDVDGAEADPQGAAAVNVAGTAHAASLQVPLVTYSTDYVFDGRKRSPYVESDGPNPMSAYGRTKLHGEAAAGRHAWVVRTSWLFGATGHNFVRTMLRLGAERDEVAVVDDQRGSPTYVGHLAAATKGFVEADLPKGLWHVAADGDCTWADFAEAIFDEAGLDCRVRRIATAELERPAFRPAYSVLRSERAGAPQLPHWRAGLRACLAETDG
jgi:dTDP-glucose 4,6-dehydratase